MIEAKQKALAASRRGFLAAGTATAFSSVLGHPSAAAASAPDGRSHALVLVSARLAAPYRHRQVVAAPKIANGSPLHHVLNSLNAYEHGYGEGPGTLHIATVLYGTGAMFGLDDAMWTKYDLNGILAAHGDAVDEFQRSLSGNPFLHPQAGVAPEHDGSVISLQRRGASMFVCKNSLTWLSREVVAREEEPTLLGRIGAKISNAFGHVPARSTADVSGRAKPIAAELAAHLVPDAICVPAGVALLNQAQEVGFTYLLG